MKVLFQFYQDTKNKHRFKEVVANDATEIIGSLYVRKGVFGNTPPEQLVVDLDGVGDAVTEEG